MKPEDCYQRYEALESSRKNLDQVLQSVERYVVPYRGEFYQELETEQSVRWQRRELWSSVPVTAAQLLASHMHGSLTSPAVKWFGLAFRDDDLQEDGEAKEWLEECERRMWSEIQESDFNSEIPECYLDLVTMGTSVPMVEPVADGPGEWEGFDVTILPIMNTYFELDGKGKPLRVYRKLMYTALQLKDEFDCDLEELGIDEKDVNARHRVVFCVYYRDGETSDEPGTPGSRRPVGYQYIIKRQKGCHVLKEGGWFEFPCFVPRWLKVAGSAWGTSPAMIGLATIRMLNETEAQVWEARAKVIDPPMKTTEFGVTGDLNLMPGGLVVVQDMNELEPLFNGTNWVEAENGVQRLENSIREMFFHDRLDLKESPAMTATEVQARLERMLRLMSPTLGRLQNDLLRPFIETLFQMMDRAGQFPERPELLQNLTDLDVEYIGPIPRAQKSEVAMGIERWLGALSQLAAQNPEMFMPMLDNPDPDFIARQLAELYGAPAEALRQQEEVDALRRERAEQAAEAQQAALVQQQGEALKSMGEGAQAASAVDPETLRSVAGG